MRSSYPISRFFSSAEVVAFEGATPVFVDVDKRTFNMSAESLELAIQAVVKEGKLIPKAVIPVDLFGQPADYSHIRAVAEKYNLLILEDGAQGFGGKINDKRGMQFWRTFPLRLFSRPNPWDVMAMGEQYLQITMCGLTC